MMSTATLPQNGNGTRPAPQAREFRATVTAIGVSVLKSSVGEKRAHEAAGRVANAFAACAAHARDATDFYECTPESIGRCIVQSALTGIMPGNGSTALAYLVPQRARKDEVPQLEYRLSHRGVNALARRCGQTMIPIPISVDDEIDTNADGDVYVVSRDIDNPPMDHESLRGIMLVVKEISNGLTITRGWVAKKLIEQRRAISQSFAGRFPQYSPWSKWPIEQAQKTAMHYAIGRGWCIIDDSDAARAIAMDAETDVVQPTQQPEPVRVEGSTADAIRSLMDASEQRTTSPDNGDVPGSVSVRDELLERARNAANEAECDAINDERLRLARAGTLDSRHALEVYDLIETQRQSLTS